MAQIFLSYAREDEAQVRSIYRRFIDAGFEVWMDKIDLLPGQRWQQEIPRAIRRADFILIFFSKNSVAKRGYVQREFRLALDTLDEMPPDAIHTIPIRLDDCEIPEQFHHLQWSDLSEEGVFDRIVQALRFGMEQRQHFTPEPALEPPPDQILNRDRTFAGAQEQSVTTAHKPTIISQPEFTNSIGMEFILIPSGDFLMGTTAEQLKEMISFPLRWLYNNETPRHQVIISQPFYLGKHPVTQAQWEAVIGDNPSVFKGNANRPVENVSWEDVQAFLRKLNERERDRDYRLPTEAQWEYACRAGTQTSRYHHDISAIAWYYANSNGQTHPVGQQLPNAWGLYDMLGNVREWCYDGKRQYTSESATDPIGRTDAGAYRIIRGGYWDTHALYVRAADRGAVVPNGRHPSIGFRCLSLG